MSDKDMEYELEDMPITDGTKPPKRPTKPEKGEEAASAELQAGPVRAAVQLLSESGGKDKIYVELLSRALRLSRDWRPPDTCDEICRKINAHLKKPGVTQAKLLHNIAASCKRHHARSSLHGSPLSLVRRGHVTATPALYTMWVCLL